jgi:glycosyltransferase involved in cell wall biosynthesis
VKKILMDRPRILFISYGFPQPGSGLGVRTDQFLRALSKIGDVSFVFRTPWVTDEKDLDYIRSLCRNVVPVAHENFTWRNSLTRLIESEKKQLKILPLLLAKKPIYINSTWLAKNKSVLLDNYLASLHPEAYDLVHVNRLYMADSAAAFISRSRARGVRTTLDVDDIESVAVERYLDFSSLGPRTAAGRMLRRMDLWRLKEYEKRILPKFDACIVCSEVDKNKIMRQKPSNHIWVLENAVDSSYFSPGGGQECSDNDMVFVGNMSYGPNVDAVRYFVHEILPIIQESAPESRFMIVGKEPVESVTELADHKSVIVTGEVADVRPYYRRAAIFVAPIRFGGGTRIKILEAMAMGNAVVTSTMGIEGITVENRKEAVIADEPAEYAKACIHLLRNRNRAKEIGSNARNFVCSRFDRQIVEHKIQECFESILSEKRTRR